MNLLVVLSHLMSKNCELGEEALARVDLAIKMFSCNEYKNLVTLGWDYRVDCDTPIAEVVRDYIIKNSDIEKASIIAINESRDTVGDALYCLDFFRDFKLKKVVVVTSDYHVDRTRFIFSHVFNKAVSIKVYGVDTTSNLDPNILLHEKRSLDAFCETFKDVDFSIRTEIFTALSERHPFYNGKVYPKISWS